MNSLRLLVVGLLLAALVPASWAQALCAYSRQSSVRQQPPKLAADGPSSGEEPKSSSQAEQPDEHDARRGQQQRELAMGELLDSNTTERCPRESSFCYSLWQEDPANKTTLLIITQGCWGTSGEEDCKSSSCVSTKKPSKVLNNTKFCCCLGDFCNINVTDGYNPSDDEGTETYLPEQFPGEKGGQTLVLVVVLCLLVAAFAIGMVLLYWRALPPQRKPGLDSAHLMEAPQHPQSPTLDMDSLKIQETIGKGRYGSVCKGSLNDCTVAVKILAQHHHAYFANEKDIYRLFHGDLPFLPRLIGSDERTCPDGRREFLLVLTHVPRGSLQDQLRKTTVDWPGLCRMAQSITKALAFLHTEEPNKPCIAHRDLTSQNVLVKDDGTCMLCDFGFAIRISGPKYIQNGEEQNAETNSLADVGTLRYMAPEVLEGAVNLRDCETSLKQVDVYALGLVFWEIATRCSDLYQGLSVPDYKMPFEAEVGIHPSKDQMQVLVARHKARPLFPDIWKDSNPAVRALKETIEDCWDHDAEARLTAVCVEERLAELPVLWDRHKAGLSVSGVSPTINATWPQHPPRAPPSCLLGPAAAQRDPDRSENTAETTLSTSLSSSDGGGQPGSNKNCASNNVVHLPSMPLQPHQGRNPCLERNLMMEPAQEVAISGNTLLEQDALGGRGKGLPPYTRLNEMSTTPAPLEDNAHALADLLLAGGGGGGGGGAARTCHPIPYVQNAVHVSTVIPKQPNLPGNGHKLPAAVKKPPAEKHRPFAAMFRKSGSSSSSSNHNNSNKAPNNNADQPRRRSLRSLFGRRSSQEGPACTPPPPLWGGLGGSLGEPVHTEVQMVEGGCRVRPVVAADAETSPLLQSKDINDNCRDDGEEEAAAAGGPPRPTTLPLHTYLSALQPKGAPLNGLGQPLSLLPFVGGAAQPPSAAAVEQRCRQQQHTGTREA